MPYELVDRATNAAHVIPPRGAWLTIGREPPEENDVVRQEQEVSRRHAQLFTWIMVVIHIYKPLVMILLGILLVGIL